MVTADLNPLSDDFCTNRGAVFRQLREIAPFLMTDQRVPLISAVATKSEFDLGKDVVSPSMMNATGVLLGRTEAQVDEIREVDSRVQHQGNGDQRDGPSARGPSAALFSKVLVTDDLPPGNDHVSSQIAIDTHGAGAVTEVELLEHLLRFNNGNAVTACGAIGNVGLV